MNRALVGLAEAVAGTQEVDKAKNATAEQIDGIG